MSSSRTYKKRKTTKQTSILSFWGGSWQETPKPPASDQRKKNVADNDDAKNSATKTVEPSSATTRVTTESPETRYVTPSKENTTLGDVKAASTSDPPVHQQNKHANAKENPKSESESTETSTATNDTAAKTGALTKKIAVTTTAEDTQLSEYELLRQRNIERNNARLAALGLVGSFQKPVQQKRNVTKARKRPAVESQRQQPPRRSTRNRSTVQSEGSNATYPLTSHTDAFQEYVGDSTPPSQMEAPQEVEYTHSPLYLYDMEKQAGDSNSFHSSKAASSNTLATNMASLTVTGPRCIAPKGLSSIYSLDFYHQDNWLVGAGKSGMIAVWNVNHTAPAHETDSQHAASNDDNSIDPIMAWKGHSGRWIADAKFLKIEHGNASSSPRALVTAGNDGNVCFWDLRNVSSSSGVPKLLHRSGKELHKSGIFCMDMMHRPFSTDTTICTGSKDKTISMFHAQSFIEHSNAPLWTSDFHSAKVGAVQLKSNDTTVLASASDDGLVAMHDYRMNAAVLDKIDAHRKPHSVVWHPNDDNLLATAGLDPAIHLWDWRKIDKPVATLEGHVPVGSNCKRIHRPVFVPQTGSDSNLTYLLSGGQGSGCLSTFQIVKNEDNSFASSLYSRGELPLDCGDAGCIAVQEDGLAAISVEQGEVLLLGPSKQ